MCHSNHPHSKIRAHAALSAELDEQECNQNVNIKICSLPSCHNTTVALCLQAE